jgi:hypothetical protein
MNLKKDRLLSSHHGNFDKAAVSHAAHPGSYRTSHGRRLKNLSGADSPNTVRVILYCMLSESGQLGSRSE